VVGALAGAGLGIGFALQGPARDFFTYLTILLDRPWRIGDLLRFEDVTGRVLQVGLRSTQLRSIDGELVIVANSELLIKTIRNFGDQQERRVLQRLVLRRDSPADAAARMMGLSAEAVAGSSVGPVRAVPPAGAQPRGPGVRTLLLPLHPGWRGGRGGSAADQPRAARRPARQWSGAGGADAAAAAAQRARHQRQLSRLISRPINAITAISST